MVEEKVTQFIDYCKICTFPFEFCEYSGTFDECIKQRPIVKKDGDLSNETVPKNTVSSNEIHIKLIKKKYNKEAMSIKGILGRPGIKKKLKIYFLFIKIKI